MQQETLSFESSLQQLQEAVRLLESGDLPLEQALQAFEEGIRHSRECHRLLERAEQRIDLILKNENGEYSITPMEESE